MYTRAELSALDDKDYRDAYVDSHVKASMAHQLRCIREDLGLTQKDFAARVEKPQSVVSRLENTEYGKVTVQTLLDLAHSLDVALVVRFASFPEFLETYGDLSPARLATPSFSSSQMNVAELCIPGVASAPLTGVFVAEAISCLYGASEYHPVNVLVSNVTTVVAGVATTPFVAFQTYPTSGRNQNA